MCYGVHPGFLLLWPLVRVFGQLHYDVIVARRNTSTSTAIQHVPYISALYQWRQRKHSRKSLHRTNFRGDFVENKRMVVSERDLSGHVHSTDASLSVWHSPFVETTINRSRVCLTVCCTAAVLLIVILHRCSQYTSYFEYTRSIEYISYCE